MTSDVALICVHCGQDAERHHHREGSGPVGKGMGGTPHEHLPEIPLCRKAHNLVHANELELSLDGDVATGRENGMVVFKRAVVVQDDHADPSFWSDEKLAGRWQDGERSALVGLATQARAAAEFYQRYKGQPEWYIRVAQIISDFNGYSVHWRDVYRRVKLYEAFGSDWDTYLRLGKTLALAVAESREPEKALDIANSRKDEGGRTSTEIIREIRGQEPPEPRRCKNCGAEI